ncbi:arrestin domain-containing protein 3-like [Echeneis naucrates]|uniref:arrestin domain-containing protein 3-like n=1 Tax=Echeneis naucrates TaxID=173247 RepID=UPI001113F125|nr:arrestin domain-containing protein 3-like [Echeneis naucrates]
MFGQTFKNFSIDFNFLNERETFSSGDPVTGHFSFQLTKETKVSSIIVCLQGWAEVHWSSGTRKHRRHYHYKLDYFKTKAAIVQESSITGGTTTLRPGVHTYPFSCQLPLGDFPTSFKGINGKIVYMFMVCINRPWHFSKDFKEELKFVNRNVVRQPDLKAPLSGSNKMALCCLWCASAPITMSVRLEKKGFIPGETVTMICDFSNGSTSTATPKVKLQEKHTFSSPSSTSSRKISKCLVSVSGQTIPGNTAEVHREITFTIPDSAIGTISNCRIIDVSYCIEVIISASNFPDLIVLFPIVLCDTPVHSQPY